MFGVGGLLGPILVYIFQEKTMGVISLMMLVIAPFYLYMASPEIPISNQSDLNSNPFQSKTPLLEVQNSLQKRSNKKGLLELNVNDLNQGQNSNKLLNNPNKTKASRFKRGSSFLRTSLIIPIIQIRGLPQSNSKQSQEKSSSAFEPIPDNLPPSDYTAYLLSGCMFLYVGMEVVYGGWVSSYAVIANVNDKSGATRFGAIYWGVITMFRFTLAFFGGSITFKLKLLVFGAVLSSLVSLVLAEYLYFVEFSLYFSAISLGLSYSSIFPLLFAFPSQFNLSLTADQTTLICQCSAIAEGVLSMLVGYLMDFHIGMFFWTLLIAAIILAFLLIQTQASMLPPPKDHTLIELMTLK